jgi:hypothetical protein
MENYDFQLLERENDGFFESSISATYIIHLVGNGRYENILTNIAEYNTSKLTYIVHNKGYKNSNKPKCVFNPPTDIIDCYFNIFKHAKLNGYINILVLEDDFLFDIKILSEINYNSINNFIISKESESFCYLLGCVPLITLNISNHHKRVLSSIGMHACIYSSKFIDSMLQINQEDIIDWDYNKFDAGINYMYYIPLCYQPFPKTDNQNYWGYDDFLKKIAGVISSNLLNIIIGESPEMGFLIFYNLRLEI